VGAAAAVLAGDALLSERTAELWRECVARLDDDDPRQVLADALQAESDPRGELMMLQLMPADPESAPARRARIRELMKQYYRVWLGPLCDIACGASFERGMLTRLELRVPTDRERWREPDYHDKELATLEEVLPISGGWMVEQEVRGECYRAIVEDPRLVSLRRIALGELGPLETSGELQHVVIDGNLAPGCRFVATHPSITSIATTPAGLSEIRLHPWFPRIETLVLATTIRRGLELWGELPTIRHLVIQPGTAYDSCELRTPHDARLELRRDGTARVAGEWMLQPLDLLTVLPAEIRRIEIEDTSERIVDRISRAVAPRGIEVALRGLIGRAGNIRWATPT